MLLACESEIKERLLAPTTFKKLSTSSARKEIAIEEYLIDEKQESVRATLRLGFSKATEFEMIVQYEASNAYGVPIRSFANCRYRTLSDNASKASKFSVIVNGMSHVDWLVNQLSKGQQRR
jgi:hypothetical protein